MQQKIPDATKKSSLQHPHCKKSSGTGFVSVPLATLGFFVSFFQMSLCDLLVEAKYAEAVKENPRHGPDLITFVWGGMAVFGLLSTGLVGFLVQGYGPQVCYLICIPFAVVILFPTGRNYFEEPRKIDASALFKAESGNRPIMGLAFLTG